MEDAEIIALYHRRDERAITETDIAHGAFCRRIAINILDIREDAEECVNDTWLAAWNKMPPDRPDCLRAFLGRITRNLSISRFRKIRAKKRFSGMEIMLSELGECISDSNVDKDIDGRELSRIISGWLDRLDRTDRALFVRRYWYGDQLKNLAEECGIPVDKLARKMQRLRLSLKKELEKEGVEI